MREPTWPDGDRCHRCGQLEDEGSSRRSHTRACPFHPDNEGAKGFVVDDVPVVPRITGRTAAMDYFGFADDDEDVVPAPVADRPISDKSPASPNNSPTGQDRSGPPGSAGVVECSSVQRQILWLEVAA